LIIASRWGQRAALAILYVLLARAALQLDPVAGFATLVWPPTGLALAALVRGGLFLWPGITVGAFLANVLTGASPAVAAGIAIGNTLEAVVGALVLRKVTRGAPALDRLRDVLTLVFAVALPSAALSATLGVASLWGGGVVASNGLSKAWMAWWMGDVAAALIVGPLLLLRAHDLRQAVAGRTRIEVALLGLSVVLAGFLVFGPGLPPVHDSRQGYLLFPVLVWAAARLRITGAVFASFLLSVIAITGTVWGYGPFVKDRLHQSLLDLQAFMLVVSATGLLLGASKAEVDATHERATFLGRIGEVLAGSLDYETTLDHVSRLAVPFFADWCIVDVVEGQTMRRVAVAAADPAKRSVLMEVRDRYPPSISSPQPAARALREGRPYLEEHFTLDNLAATTRDARHFQLMSQLEPRSAMALPMRLPGRTVGMLTFALAESGRRYTRADVALGEEIARRAAVALENARLHRASEWWEHVFEHAGWGVALTDAETGLLQAINPAFARMHGYLASDLIGQPLALVLPPDQRQELSLRLPAEDGGRVIFESEHQRKDGTRFPILVDMVGLRDAKGRLVRAANVIDISERKQVEDERARLLESEKAARAEAEEASRAKDEFLAMLGHELRNPLSPMVTALHLMKLRGHPSATSKEHQVLERQTRHLVRLVDDLLDVSRITRGKITLHRSELEIATVIAAAVEMAQPLLEQRRHVLSIEVPRTGLSVLADPDRLAQVLTNLLTNAAKYTPLEGRIGISARREAGEVVVRVTDNGMGISPALLPTIFEPFVQGPRSAARSEGGLGIGLALVKSLVTLHGGSVAAASEGPDQGSEFVVRLPLVASTVEALTPAPSKPAARSPAPLRVLIVDDNRDAADLTAEMLQDLGYDVSVAFDPATALDLVSRSVPDVAVLDIGLPVMDGYELARQMRARIDGPPPRFVAMTGYGQEADRARSDAAGFAAHLVKPVSFETLLRAVAPPNAGPSSVQERVAPS
jgi:PAS domain S-box-containing protein